MLVANFYNIDGFRCHLYIYILNLNGDNIQVRQSKIMVLYYNLSDT